MAIRKFDYARENKYVGETFSSTSFDGTIDEFPDYSTQIMKWVSILINLPVYNCPVYITIPGHFSNPQVSQILTTGGVRCFRLPVNSYET